MGLLILGMTQMKKIIALLFVLLSLAACGGKTQHKSQATISNSSDVKVLYISDADSPILNYTKDDGTLDLKGCRENIAKVVCLVDPMSDNREESSEESYDTKRLRRKCLPGTEKYIPVFEDHFDHSEKMIQGMYCALSRIWIENTLASTAYASPIYNKEEKLVAVAMGINRKFLDSNIDMDTWLSWKEETSFGGQTDMMQAQTRMNLITYKSNKKDNKKFVISDTIIHEFGHMFDYANNLNRYADECSYLEPEKCIPGPGSWGENSWKNINEPIAQDDFLLRSKLCFYRCKGSYIEKDQADDLFESLFATKFHSIYAATNPYDDFAEFFSYHFSINKDIEPFDLHVEVLGKSYDISKFYKSQAMEGKRQFLNNFIESKYLYPGQ